MTTQRLPVTVLSGFLGAGMNSPVIPQTFAQWRHCIEVECRIPLEPVFIQQRLAQLRDLTCEDTRRFSGLYGQAHLDRVTSWFEQPEGVLEDSVHPSINQP